MKRRKLTKAGEKTTERIILTNIGSSILDYNKGNYKNAHQMLDLIDITHVKFKKKFFSNTFTITVYCERPGILIGKQGNVINLVKEALAKRFTYDIVINVKPVDIKSALYPFDFMDY